MYNPYKVCRLYISSSYDKYKSSYYIDDVKQGLIVILFLSIAVAVSHMSSWKNFI